MTHPFHPLSGQKFEFVKRRKIWSADRVYIYDATDEVVSLPAEWTDMVAADPFVVVSAGRSPFRTADLLELSQLLLELTSRSTTSVKPTTPEVCE